MTYAAQVATSCAVPLEPGEQDWADLAALLGPGALADLFSLPAQPPADWAPVFSLEAVQLVGPVPISLEPDPDVVELGAADVPEMLALAEATRPGPFWRRTHELGRYVGVRVDGRLVAMAGERLRPPGWTEISGVCTMPEARGRGLAGRLVRELAGGIAARGGTPFLHVTEGNPARGLYEHLGFRARTAVRFHGCTVPDALPLR